MNVIKKISFFPSIFLSLVYCLGFVQPGTMQVSTLQHYQLHNSAIKSDTQSIASGSFDSLYNFLVSKFEQKNIQDFGIASHRSFSPVGVTCDEENNDEAVMQSAYLLDAKAFRHYFLSFLLLFSASQHALYGMETGDETRSIFSGCFPCVPENIRSLPVTFMTNLTGNGVANIIAVFSPDPITAGGSACAVGCVGGCLEGFSSDTKYMSQKTIDLHRNFKTGFVADAICIPFGSCFTTPIANASAIGAPVGYCAGLKTGLAARYCCDRYAKRQEAHRAVVAVAPIDRE